MSTPVRPDADPAEQSPCRDTALPYGRSILILIPHADDEAVGCAAAVRRARALGASVHGLYLTDGLPPREIQWPWRRRAHPRRVARRRAEAEAAAVLLGIRPAAYLEGPARELRHRLDAARRAARRAAEAVRADRIWTPAFEGGHQDHDAANALAATLRDLAPVWEFAEYNNAGGRAGSNRFPQPAGGEITLTLDAEEIALKRRALACYASEAANLGHIATGQEVLRPLPDHDYGTPPHAGTLFYTRFQWVPFRHPRVDFTPPDALYHRLIDWLQSVQESQ